RGRAPGGPAKVGGRGERAGQEGGRPGSRGPGPKLTLMAGSSTTARALAEARRFLDEFASAPENVQWVDSLAAIVHERFGSGCKVMVCGNGGSACDAMHFAEELTGRFREDRAALPAMACTDF